MPKVPLDNPDKDGRPRKARLIVISQWPCMASTRGSDRTLLPCRFSGFRVTGQNHGARGPINQARKQFVVKKPNDEQEYAWTVNIKSPLYRDLLGFLPKSPIMLRVIRTGEGRTDTRYTVKAA